MKKTLLLLHGALESSSQFSRFTELAQPYFDIKSFEFIGHGSAEPVDSFTIGDLSDQLKQYLNSEGLKEVNILGYSMGGYVALHALPSISNHLSSIYTLATKLSWTNEFVGKELKKLVPEIIEEKVPKLIVKLEQEHPKSPWKSMINGTSHMIKTIQNFPLAIDLINSSNIPINILRGSEDVMVTSEECQKLSDNVDLGNYIELEDTPHMFHKMNSELLLRTIIQNIE